MNLILFRVFHEGYIPEGHELTNLIPHFWNKILLFVSHFQFLICSFPEWYRIRSQIHPIKRVLCPPYIWCCISLPHFSIFTLVFSHINRAMTGDPISITYMATWVNQRPGTSREQKFKSKRLQVLFLVSRCKGFYHLTILSVLWILKLVELPVKLTFQESVKFRFLGNEC